MLILQRDLKLLKLVADFRLLTPKQMQQLLFSDLSSNNPLDRTLARLLKSRHLARVGLRLVGGSRGGSGQFVYRLGLEGHKLMRDSGGKWQNMQTVNFNTLLHTLAIVDTHVMLKRLERAGRLVVTRFLTEPLCHVTVGDYQLKPDLYEELARPGSASVIRFMCEIDQGSQSQKQIGEKLARYYKAAQLAGEGWPQNLLVVFIAVDDERAQELVFLLEKETPEVRAMFRVRTLAALEAELN